MDRASLIIVLIKGMIRLNSKCCLLNDRIVRHIYPDAPRWILTDLKAIPQSYLGAHQKPGSSMDSTLALKAKGKTQVDVACNSAERRSRSITPDGPTLIDDRQTGQDNRSRQPIGIVRNDHVPSVNQGEPIGREPDNEMDQGRLLNASDYPVVVKRGTLLNSHLE